MSSAVRKFDLVIFGATGFTGQFVVEAVGKLIHDQNLNLQWAVAGRNEKKLKDGIVKAEKETGLDLSAAGIVIADVTDKSSLVSMAQQSKVILNTVGPYHFWGEPVVKACVENSCSHVDISGEPQFLEGMQVKYHQAAQRNGCYVVGACGADSIPADIGTTLLMDKFNGDLNSVEMYVTFNQGSQRLVINYGTWLSLINIFPNMSQVPELRRKLYPTHPPKPEHKLRDRGVLHWSRVINRWCIPLPETDKSVMDRSQYHFWSEHDFRPVQTATYFATSSWLEAVLMILGFLVLKVLTRFNGTRSLLSRYPEVMSLGTFSRTGPAREQLRESSFCTTIRGKGWHDKLAEPSDQHQEPPTKQLKVEVSAVDPAYATTAACMVQCGMVILQEKEKMPSSGGVYPPGAAFYGTSLIDRLNKSGIKFTVKEE